MPISLVSLILSAHFALACISNSEMTLYPGHGNEGFELIQVVKNSTSGNKSPSSSIKIEDDDGNVNLLVIAHIATTIPEEQMDLLRKDLVASLKKQDRYWKKIIAEYSSSLSDPEVGTLAKERIAIIKASLETNKALIKELEKRAFKKSDIKTISEIVMPLAPMAEYGYQEYKDGTYKKAAKMQSLMDLMPETMQAIQDVDKKGNVPLMRSMSCNTQVSWGGKKSDSNERSLKGAK